MTSQELRLGNLVYVNEDSVCRVYEINDLAFYVMGDDECSYKNTTCELQPIPLTEEWLLKFGFILLLPIKGDFDRLLSQYSLHNGNFILEKVYGGFNLCSIQGYFNLSFKKNAVSGVNAIPHGNYKSVHQLQNLYFALTGEELTLTGN